MTASKFDRKNETQVMETTLDLLDAVESGKPISQRGLSSRLGVALGLTNTLVKRCVRKGLLKVSQAPARRYAYYVTPAGLAEKSRLTAEYISSSLNFFRNARNEYAELTEYCVNREWRYIVLFGAGDLSEIALLALQEAGLTPIAIVDEARNQSSFFGIPVVRSLEELGQEQQIDAVMLAETERPQRLYDSLRERNPELHILAPRLLRIAAAGS